ncbi:hypothetical protein Taro_051938, partial [Colocasia esculenta]|nr:hypothetical protein [Colocasia esculenta]
MSSNITYQVSDGQQFNPWFDPWLNNHSLHSAYDNQTCIMLGMQRSDKLSRLIVDGSSSIPLLSSRAASNADFIALQMRSHLFTLTIHNSSTTSDGFMTEVISNVKVSMKQEECIILRTYHSPFRCQLEWVKDWACRKMKLPLEYLHLYKWRPSSLVVSSRQGTDQRSCVVL